MTFFQHTKRDLADARKEIGEALLALADDTARKMNDEEVKHNRIYLLEDLLIRLALIAKEAGADVSIFPNVQKSMRVRPAYELLDMPARENEPVNVEITRDLAPALYSSTNAKTSRPGMFPRQGVTRVEEGGAYKS